MARYTLKNAGKRPYHRETTLSKAEIMLIIMLFHDSGYRCFKHFYLDYVCKHLRHLFPKVVSYNRFVELDREVAIPLALFIKKVLLGKCTGISFVDSTPIRFDITYARFDKVKYRNFRRYESVEKAILKNVLGEVLQDLRKQNKCYVKYEVKQRCFHITTRM